ncbi:MAG: alkyl hydroperoxide reductase, partial [Gemmataceae bacterium]|nr:alkyl hydroperoxide reductase [Gemmataceae bacterium]
MLALLVLSAAEIGGEVKGLSFKDIRFLVRTLDDLPKGKPVVLAFADSSVPLPALVKLEKEQRAKASFAVVNGGGDSIRAMAAHAVAQEAEFPFLKDHDGKAAARLGVERQGTAVILDAARRLRWRGGLAGLPDALAAILAGKPAKEAKPDGPAIIVPKLPKPAKPPTFAGQVGPILHRHCVECHRPGTAA